MEEKLPEDVLIGILCRLPIKCLVGFKCVSKSWNTLISDVCVPRISRGPLPLSGFLFWAARNCDEKQNFMDYVSYHSNDDATGDGFVESYSSLLPTEYSPYDVLDCCNGLILFISKSIPRYFVCNPATKQCVVLPKHNEHWVLRNAALAFDPCESVHYKVVCFVYAVNYSASNPPGLDIFSSETGKWIRYDLVVEPPYGLQWVRRTVYLNGILYKVTKSKHLLQFNLKTLTTQAIELPYNDKIDEYGSIGVSKGAFFYADCDGPRILIWHFEYRRKGGPFWTLKHCVCAYDLLMKHPASGNRSLRYNPSVLKPLAMHPASDIIFMGTSSMVFSYDIESRKFELVYNRGIESLILCGKFFFYPYTRCFITLNDASLNK